ncbi:right-handed parallel beta-helix repeat-containing protein [Enterobacter hormaechei]|uniref:right-handed parallel beta-helix repeat-containing protein n=1 Tax=Enterobacter hormaechei TaxID=158836 RepID=UPI003A9722ED
MITNVICECVCVIKYTALSKFTGFWAGAFHGNGLTLLYSYGLLGTNCTFHYSTGVGVYAINITDCTFVSSSVTNSEGGGFDLDDSVRTIFVACTFSKFDLY